MATFIGTEAAFEDVLKNLVQLDFNAAAAYQAAIDRVSKERLKAALRRFKADHLRHTRELGACMRDLGQEPPREGDLKQLVTTGKVVMAGLVGDTAILTAMRTNEDDTVTAYDRAVRHPDCVASVLGVLKRAQKDEHRHREWMVTALKTGTAKRARHSTRARRSTPRTAKAARPKRAARKRTTKRRAGS